VRRFIWLASAGIAWGCAASNPGDTDSIPTETDTDADADADTDADTDTDLTGDSGDTGAGTTDTGIPCPPPLANRVITGDLDLAVDRYARITGTGGFGFNVAAVGDITNDGKGDYIGVAPFVKNAKDIGAVYLIPGPIPAGDSDLDSISIELVDATPGDDNGVWFPAAYFGTIATLPDQNGDGMPEVALGSPQAPAEHGAGAVYILQSPIVGLVGSSAPYEPASYLQINPNSVVSLGTSLATGDLGGDGSVDLLVSAPANGAVDGELRGGVYAFEGPLAKGVESPLDADFTVLPDLAQPAGSIPLALGQQMVVDDFDGDGVADAVVTAPGTGADDLQASGTVYWFAGPLTANVLDTDATGTLRGETLLSFVGNVANALGDTDGDGYAEVAIGGWGGLDTTGHAWVVDGAVAGVANVSDRADTEFVGAQPQDDAEWVNSAGDLDSDGAGDLVIAAAAIAGDARGGALVYYGPLAAGVFGVNDAPDARIYGDGSPPITVMPARDVDADCGADLLFGAFGSATVDVLRGGTE
jgi:hypothetical protein